MDEHYMNRAFELAQKGQGHTTPNPMVGAVIVQDGRIVGEGYHETFGGAHAEINALNDVQGQLNDATMYVTLEPCNHYGKTPPCSLSIANASISRVVIASLDQSEKAGGGAAFLKKQGIDVTSGILHEKNETLNRPFFHHIRTGRPYVVLKTAMSADGKIATYTHDSKWISNEQSRAFVHELRHNLHAIMVGANTVLNDNPKLTARRAHEASVNPVRIVIDSGGVIPLDANVLNTAEAPTIIVTTQHAETRRIKQYEAKGVRVIIARDHEGVIPMDTLMDVLGKEGIQSILLEGGAHLNEAAMRAGIIQTYYNFIAPKLIGGKTAPTPISGEGVRMLSDAVSMRISEIKRFGDDVLIVYEMEEPYVHRNH